MTLNERCAMTLDDLRALADKFFVWPEGSGRQTVTLFSALLFAQHVLQLREMHEMHEKSLGAENSAGINALRDAAQRQLDALGGYRREIGLLTGVPDEQPCDAEVAARAALEQAEPVAWMCPEDPERETAFSWEAGHCENCGKQRIPLYAALGQDQDPELSAALGWPGGISDPVLDREALLQQVARLVERAHGIEEEE